MKLFLKCFGCKRKQKIKFNKSVNNSGFKFTSLVTPEPMILKNNNSQKTKEQQINETQEKKTEKKDDIENKKEIVISEEKEEKVEEKKEKKIESLINEEPEKDKDTNVTYSKFGLNLNPEIGFDDPLIKPNSPIISDFEKDQKFTKKNFIDLFNKFWNLDNYKKVWDKDNLIIEIRSEGTEIKNEINIIKISYRQLKKEFNENADIEILLDFLYEPSLRILWDKVLKNIEVLEGNKKTNYIISTWAKSPVFFMSERESLEKRFIYKNPEENAIYIMSSSIPDELFPPKDNVVRIINYCNYYKLIDEGEYIGFYSLNQTDFKMPIPQFLINVTLPTTTKNWQNYLEIFAKEVKYDKTNCQLTYINEKEEKE